MSGQAAIELAEKKHYDIIFLDHMMPKLDGVETLAILKERGLVEGTAVIALTANAVLGAREMYLGAGFSDYLSKPIESEQLEKKLVKYLPEKLVTYRTFILPTAADPYAAEQSDLFGYSELTDMRERCPGLNVLTGMGYCMDSKEFYLETLQAYYDSDRCTELEMAFSQKDTEDYRIIVHSVKSASLTIGAVQLSEHAKMLEFAARDGDDGYIREHHAGFIDEYKDILSGIGKVLGK